MLGQRLPRPGVLLGPYVHLRQVLVLDVGGQQVLGHVAGGTAARERPLPDGVPEPDGLAALFADLRDQSFETIGAARAEHEFRAIACEPQRGRLADAAAGAGDDDDLSRYSVCFCRHGWILFLT